MALCTDVVEARDCGRCLDLAAAAEAAAVAAVPLAAGISGRADDEGKRKARLDGSRKQKACAVKAFDATVMCEVLRKRRTLVHVVDELAAYRTTNIGRPD